jgi:ssDNA thymidine ADP-ribosyltransferase, DarT
VILCSSLADLKNHGVQFIFTDRHAYLAAAQVFTNESDLQHMDWKILQNKDFKRDTNDLGKVERYEAEALIYKLLPIKALRGIACVNASAVSAISAHIKKRDLSLAVEARPNWFF